MMVALAHSHVAAAFNVAFYSVAATVIPVLFVAIAVQGALYEKVLKSSGGLLQRAMADIPGAGSRQLAAVTAVGTAVSVAVLVIAFGVAGEITAITALARQRAAGADIVTAEISVIILTVVAAAQPAWMLASVALPARARLRQIREEIAADDASTEAGSTSPPHEGGAAEDGAP